MSGAVLKLRGVSRHFGGVAAVSDVTLDVEPGARHGIIGPNGAGKTTLFNAISGAVLPDEGKVEIAGWDATRGPVGQDGLRGSGRHPRRRRTAARLPGR